MKVYGKLEKAQFEILSSDPSNAQIGMVYYNSVSGRVRVYNGSSWSSIGSASGGGGSGSGGIYWTNEGPDAALASVENGQEVFLFSKNLSQSISCSLRVPLSYTSGNPINLYMLGYSPSITGDWQIQTTATLVRVGVTGDSFATTTNQLVSTLIVQNNAIPGVANSLKSVLCNITDGSGKINSVNVSAGDIIKIKAVRTGGTDTSDVRILNSASEVTFE